MDCRGRLGIVVVVLVIRKIDAHSHTQDVGWTTTNEGRENQKKNTYQAVVAPEGVAAVESVEEDQRRRRRQPAPVLVCRRRRRR